ncbi:MAG: 3-deoxy-8-phosphooctulonate synthase [Elusimicrobia bacterium]|nr:3-deoxy-8-phosphooctulonate synthase [Elusimicrobiota bacterium]
MNAKKVKVNDTIFSNDEKLVYIMGPCVIESERDYRKTAIILNKIFSKLKTKFIIKASFDKANRTSHKSFRGIGFEKSIKFLAELKKELKINLLADVHEKWQVERIKNIADIIQIPAFLCRQTDLLFACADTGKTINVKKGQFLAPWDMVNVIKKIESRGNRSILLTERGSSFGYGNLVADMRSIEIMKETGYPVIFDCTHSVQRPGALGTSTGGDIRFSIPLAKAAAILKIAGIFMETHPNPSKALSDGHNSMKLDNVPKAVNMLNYVDSAAKKAAEFKI